MSLSRADQDFVYILGSVILMDISHVDSIYTVVGFLHLQSVTVRQASIIEPGVVVVESIRFGHEGVIIYPLTD